MSAGRPPATEPAPLLLADVAEQYLADLSTRARPRGVVESRSILTRVVHELGAERVDQLTPRGVLEWRQRRVAGGSSNKTVNNALAVLVAALTLCVTLGQIGVLPIQGVRSLPTGPRHQRRRPRALTEWEIARVLAAAEDLDREASQRATAARTITGGSKGAEYAARARSARIPQAIIVRALLETGARWGELTFATWADVDEPGATLLFRGENTKTETERAVPLRTGFVEELRSYRLACAAALGAMPPPSARVFLSPQGKPCGRGTSNFRRFLGAAYERAGLLEPAGTGGRRSRDGRALNVHTLRHTACSRLLAAGASVPVVQAILGHASPAMTLRVYAHARAEEGRAAVEALGAPPAPTGVLPGRVPSAGG